MSALSLLGVSGLTFSARSANLLRVSTAGSVDDGKSTLIGRLFHDAKSLMEDQLLALKKEGARRGKTGGHIDFAALTDGLKSEREQGITIDVAYRYFPKRAFILADTPGHEQYTRNMATGASTADCVRSFSLTQKMESPPRQNGILTYPCSWEFDISQLPLTRWI